MRVLGIDPGRTGAAVAIDHVDDSGRGHVCEVWSWSPVRSGGYTLLHQPTSVARPERRSLGSLADLAGSMGSVSAAAVEALYVPREAARGRLASLVTLAESAGQLEVVARVGLVDGGALYRVRASTWRSRILRAGAMSRADAEARAMQCAPRLFVGADVLPTVHAVEAACMALWCWHRAMREDRSC